MLCGAAKGLALGVFARLLRALLAVLRLAAILNQKVSV